MKNRVFVLVLVVLMALCATLVQAADAFEMPVFWLYAQNPDGTNSRAGFGLSDINRTSPADFGSSTARIAIRDIYNWTSDQQLSFMTQSEPMPQEARPWGAYLWVTPDFGRDSVDLMWTSQNIPDYIMIKLWIVDSTTGLVHDWIGVDTRSIGFINLPAIVTDNWKNGWYVEVEMWNTSPITSTVPEPSSLVAIGTGFVGLLGFIRRRKIS